MAKRIAGLLLALTMTVLLSVPALAASGFIETGGYTVTDPAYTMLTDEAVLVFNKEVDRDPDYTEVFTGSAVYVPIYALDEETDVEQIATAKKIKDDKVEVNYKPTVGTRYIDSVTIVDGKKEKGAGLSSGSYVKIALTDSYTGTSYTTVSAKIVLSVNKVSYQESRVTFECRLTNRMEYINDNSVYGAQVPTKFKVDSWYNGDVTFDMGAGVKYSALVKRDARYAIDFSRDPDYDVDLMYPDAYMEFYNFRGNNDTFASVGTLSIPVDTKNFKDPATGQPRVYAYEILENKQLRALGSDAASYDSKNKILSIRTQTLGHYVLSNQKLRQTIDPDQDQTFQSGYATDAEITGMSAEQVEEAPTAPQSLVTPTPAQTQEPLASTMPASGGSDNLIINATNNRGYNPPTGPVGRPASALLLGCISLPGLFTLRRRKDQD